MFIVRKLIRQSPVCYAVCRNVSKQKIRKEVTGKDPGILRRRQLLGVEKYEEIDDDFEDFDSDFMDVHQSHKEYEKENAFLKERDKHFIVKQKYFKEKFPNFLTWHDKEQMRYLYRTDPDEWTIDKLSEGFPALPHVIKKIVKSNYAKTEPGKISKHDELVQKNWNAFKAGQLSELPPHLVEHLNKFTSRALIFKRFEIPVENKVAKPKRLGEFAQIIASYEKLKENVESEVKLLEEKTETVSEEFSKNVRPRRRLVTLNHLQENLSKRMELGREIDEDEAIILQSCKKDLEEIETKEEIVDLTPNKFETGVISEEKSARDLAHLSYPQRIRIPGKIYKKGNLYKLNDCYYDDDGEFLYRVPGMC